MTQSQAEKPTGYPLGRLFVVPLIIVLVIVGCAVAVVLSFGAITSFKEVPVQDLLGRLESASGERSAGVLMPRDKELWQAAQELALRLEAPARELTDQDLPEVRQRLTRLLERNLDGLGEQPETVRQITYFTMHAAARSGAAGAVPLLVRAALEGQPDVQREALRALAWMGSVPEARAEVRQLLILLEDDAEVVRIFACLVLANLGDAGDAVLCQVLLKASRRLDDSPDVRWNAVLALARFGYDDPGGWVAAQTCELLDRDFWESRRVQYTAETAGGVREVDRRLSPAEVENRLIAALDAAENMTRDSVRACIAALEQDQSLKVANRARQAAGLPAEQTGSE